MTNLYTLLLPCIASLLLTGQALAASNEKKILVYTRNYVTNGKGYVHENIPYCVAAIQKMGAGNSFAVDVSDDPAVFTPDKEQTFLTVMKPWAEAVNKEAAGAIEIDLFPNGALGRSPLQQGSGTTTDRVLVLEQPVPRSVRRSETA